MWKGIDGFPGYEVSDNGAIRSFRQGGNGRLLKLQVDKDGYHRIGLFCGGVQKFFYVHRLVMAAFVGPCPNGLQVNHKNGIKTKNCPENLEYVTVSENVLHAFRTGLKHPTFHLGRRIGQFTKGGELVTVFESVRAADRAGFQQWNIANCCNGKYGFKTHKGFVWKYVA